MSKQHKPDYSSALESFKERVKSADAPATPMQTVSPVKTPAVPADLATINVQVPATLKKEVERQRIERGLKSIRECVEQALGRWLAED